MARRGNPLHGPRLGGVLDLSDERFPRTIEGLGSLRVGPFTRCARCPASAHLSGAGTFVRYGDDQTPLCAGHAWRSYGGGDP